MSVYLSAVSPSTSKCKKAYFLIASMVSNKMKEDLPEKRNSLWYSQKISQIRTRLGLSQAAFAQKIGVSGAAIGQLERGESKSPSADLLAALASMLSVNLDWLLNGEGEMLKSDQPQQSQTQSQNSAPYMSANPETELASQEPPQRVQPSDNLRILTVQVAPDGDENIELVPVWAAAGYAAGGFIQPVFMSKLPSFRLPGATFRNGSFRCFQVQGSSMQGTLQDGDWVVCRYVEKWAHDILDNRVYVVVTEEDILVKRVLNQINERGQLTLHSDNPSFDVQAMDWQQVREVWQGVGRITLDLSNTRLDLPTEFAKQQALLADVLRRLDKLEGYDT